jgi:hypothetical protein
MWNGRPIETKKTARDFPLGGMGSFIFLALVLKTSGSYFSGIKKAGTAAAPTTMVVTQKDQRYE